MDVIGKISSVPVEEKYFNEKEEVDIRKINLIILDPFTRGYFSVGERIGSAWSIGKDRIK